MQDIQKDAMKSVRKFGKPDLFLQHVMLNVKNNDNVFNNQKSIDMILRLEYLYKIYNRD